MVMSEIREKVKQAQRRLWLIRWLGHLGWSLAGAAAVFAAFVVVERLALAMENEWRVFQWVGGSLAGAGLLASIIWTLITRESLSIAAARLDDAAMLKERLSTALHFSSSPDPFAKAAVADADRVSRMVTPRKYLPVRVPRSASYCGGAFFMSLMLCWLFPVVDLAGKQAVRQEQQLKQEQLKRTQAEVKPIIDKLKKLQTKRPELKGETQPAAELAMAKLDTPMDLRRAAIKKVNDAAAQVNEKKNQTALAKVEDFKQMLRRLAAQPTPPSTVGNLSKSLAKGDFKSAKESLESLRNELSKAPTTPEEKARQEQLRSDLRKLAQQVNKIAENDSKLKEQLQELNLSQEEVNKLLDKLNKGQVDQVAKELAAKGLSQQQIDKLKQQAEKALAARKDASKLAKNLAKAAQQKKDEKGNQNEQADGKDQKGQQQDQQANSQKGEQKSKDPGEQDSGDSGGDGLSMASEQLSEMESLQEEMAELNAMSADLAGMKDSLGQGEGSEGQPDEAGPGMGPAGQGEGGIAQKQETAIGLSPQRTKVHTMSGAIIDQRFVEGEQYKGEVSSDFVEAVLGARQDLSDASRHKNQPRHIKLKEAEYFNHMDADLPKDKVEAAKKKMEEK